MRMLASVGVVFWFLISVDEACAQRGGCQRGGGGSMALSAETAMTARFLYSPALAEQSYRRQLQMAYQAQAEQARLQQIDRASEERSQLAIERQDEKRKARIAMLRERREAEQAKRDAAREKNLRRREAEKVAAQR